jgi:tRNA-specific 2-thiouridylase
VQLRAHGETLPARVSLAGDRLTAQLGRPARGIATGQAVVCYHPDADGDIVLGSATIAATA